MQTRVQEAAEVLGPARMNLSNMRDIKVLNILHRFHTRAMHACFIRWSPVVQAARGESCVAKHYSMDPATSHSHPLMACGHGDRHPDSPHSTALCSPFRDRSLLSSECTVHMFQFPPMPCNIFRRLRRRCREFFL